MRTSILYMLSLLLAALLTLALMSGISLWLYKQALHTKQASPSEENLTSHVYNSTNMRFMSGQGLSQDDTLLIKRFDKNQQVIISSGFTGIKADHYPILHIKLKLSVSADNRPETKPDISFFWRTKDEAHILHSVPLNPERLDRINLMFHEQWRGIINEVGLLITDTGHDYRIHELRFDLPTINAFAHVLMSDWLSINKQVQSRINFNSSSSYGSPLSLLIFLSLFLFITFLYSRFLPAKLHAVTLLCICCWAGLEIRWFMNSPIPDSEQQQAKSLPATFNPVFIDFIEELKTAWLPEHPVKLVILFRKESNQHLIRYAKYHLIPHNVSLNESLPDRPTLLHNTYILIPNSVRGITWRNSNQQLYWSGKHKIKATLIRQNAIARLYFVPPPKKS